LTFGDGMNFLPMTEHNSTDNLGEVKVSQQIDVGNGESNNNNNNYSNNKEAEKFLKYKDLTIEIQCTWNVKEKVISVITGATGTLSKSLGHYLSNIPGKHEIKELQKTSVLGTSHKLRKVLMYKY
jgi:hypothetical protein